MEKQLHHPSPLVSVIVLSYNHASTLPRALDSVLAIRGQCADLEIVIGDDGSTDGSYEICRRFADAHPDIVRLMEREPNMGLVRNYFRCLKACRGEFVTDCAGDDVRLPGTWLEKQLSALRDDSSLVAVGSDWIVRDANGDTHSASIANHAQWRHKVGRREMLLGVLGAVGYFPVLLSAVLYRREAVNPDDPMVCNPYFGCEDLPVMCALGNAGNFGFVEEESMVYFISDGSVSNSGSSLRQLDFYYKAVLCRCALANCYHARTPQVNNAIAAGVRYVIGKAFECGKDEWTAVVRQLADKCDVHLTLVSRIKLWIMGHGALWRVARRVM